MKDSLTVTGTCINYAWLCWILLATMFTLESDEDNYPCPTKKPFTLCKLGYVAMHGENGKCPT